MYADLVGHWAHHGIARISGSARHLCVTSDLRAAPVRPPVRCVGEARWSQPASPTRAASGLLMEGRLAEARVEFWQEVDEADAAGDAVALAEAAIGLGGCGSTSTARRSSGPASAPLQERALRGLAPRGTTGLPVARPPGRRAGATSAVTAARCSPRSATPGSSGDPVALAEALSIAHHCLLGPAHGPNGLALADELIARRRSPTARPTR